MRPDTKWSRLSALKPAGPPVAPTPATPDRLVALLEGEIRSNHAGDHIVVRRQFPTPDVPGVSADALRLIAPSVSTDLLDPHRWLFLDTETTGLAGGTGTYAFLVGAARWEAQAFTVEQFFMRHHGEERSMLTALASRLAEHNVIVTFNGKSFDWPLLETRYRMTRAATIAAPPIHLDLLYPARQLWRLSLRSVALSELERHVLSLDRGSDIPADTIPRRYFDYLRAGIAEPLAEVFRHNQMDLRGLAMLACRVAALLESPGENCCAAGELFGISRMLQRKGDADSAGLLYQRALESGLPEEAGRIARRELAGMARRNRDYERANALWEQLRGGSSDGLDAYEQLAIHYEHRAGQPDRAAALTREALVELQEAYRAGRIGAQAYRARHAALHQRLTRVIQKSEQFGRKM